MAELLRHLRTVATSAARQHKASVRVLSTHTEDFLLRTKIVEGWCEATRRVSCGNSFVSQRYFVRVTNAVLCPHVSILP
jgi:exopolyphosphatase/pppGpp-phosphohydrolase